MSDTARPKSVGDKISALEINQDLPIEVTAGTPISSTPQAVYVKIADGYVYPCSSATPAATDFIGFTLDVAGGSGSPITMQTHGVVTGFSGLTAGDLYYVQDDKTIGTPVGTYESLVGIAVSATQILILTSNLQYVGSDSSTPFSPPSIARHAIVACKVTDSEDNEIQGELFVSRKGKTTAVLRGYAAPIGEAESHRALVVTVTWNSDGSISATPTQEQGATGLGLVVTAYFYR